MKTIILFSNCFLIFTLCFTTQTFSQQKEGLYYWSSGKKFVLQTDSLTLIADTKLGADKSDVERQLITKRGVAKVESMIIIPRQI